MKKALLILFLSLFLLIPLAYAIEGDVGSWGFDPKMRFVDPYGETFLADLAGGQGGHIERNYLAAPRSLCDLQENRCTSLPANYQMPTRPGFNPLSLLHPFHCADINSLEAPGYGDQPRGGVYGDKECFFVPAELGNARTGCDARTYESLQQSCPTISQCGATEISVSNIEATGCTLEQDPSTGADISFCNYDTSRCYEALEVARGVPCDTITARTDCVDDTLRPLNECQSPGQSANYCQPVSQHPIDLRYKKFDASGVFYGEYYEGICAVDTRQCGSGTGTGTTPTPTQPSAVLGQACQGIGNFNINDYKNIGSSSPHTLGLFDADNSNSLSYKTDTAGIFVDEANKIFYQDDCPNGEGAIQGVTPQQREWVNILTFYNLYSQWSTTDTDYMNSLREIGNYQQADPQHSCFDTFINAIDSQCAGTCETLGDLPNPNKNYDAGCAAYCLTNQQDGFGKDPIDLEPDLRLGFTFDCPGDSYCFGTLLSTGKNGIETQTTSATIYAPAGYTQKYNVGQGDVEQSVSEGAAIFAGACISLTQQKGMDIGPGTQNPTQDQLFCCTSSSLECKDKNICPEGYRYNPNTRECESMILTGQAVGGQDFESCKINGLQNTPEFKEIAAIELQKAFSDLSDKDLTQTFKTSLKIMDNQFSIAYIKDLGKTTDEDATKRVYEALNIAIDKTTPNPWPQYTYCVASATSGGAIFCAMRSIITLLVPNIGHFEGLVPDILSSAGMYSGQVPEIPKDLTIELKCEDSYVNLEIKGSPNTNHEAVAKTDGEKKNKGTIKTNANGDAKLVLTDVEVGAVIIVSGNGLVKFETVPSCEQQTDAGDLTGGGSGSDEPTTTQANPPTTLTGAVCTNPQGCATICADGNCQIQTNNPGTVSCPDCQLVTCSTDGCGTCTGTSCATVGPTTITLGCPTGDCAFASDVPIVLTPVTTNPGTPICIGPSCYTTTRTGTGTGVLTVCSDLTGSCAELKSGTFSVAEILSEIATELPYSVIDIPAETVSITRGTGNQVIVSVSDLTPGTPYSITAGDIRLGTVSLDGTVRETFPNLAAGTQVIIVAHPNQLTDVATTTDSQATTSGIMGRG